MKKYCAGISVFLLVAMMGCGNSDNTTDHFAQNTPIQQPKEQTVLAPEGLPALNLPEGVSVQVTIPQAFGRRISASRKVSEKTMPLSEFTRTIESTNLIFNVSLSKSALMKGNVSVKLMSDGYLLQSESQNSDGFTALSIQLSNVRTPYLTSEQRSVGYKMVNYELLIVSGSKLFRVPFQVAVYDEYLPTLVMPRKGECLIYLEPERASGCYQNRTRTTQEVVFNDNITNTHEVDVQFTGGFSIPISIVSLSFGVSRTSINSTETSKGSEIHFTNCILCSSVIYRQEVKSIRKGDVYQVMADGSMVLGGETTVVSKQVAYEFTSTGSESQDYNCDIKSKLPVGYSPGCSL